jgi:hypothetical protein|tara:strand:- start:253 stop:522 length:270 start_codon:yes stop_codon:yes gene_type:complete
MKNLEAYIEQKNAWNKIFSIKAINFPLSQANANELMNMIGSELSPENLHCDGEASLTHVRAKAKQLNLVSKQLEQYCLDNWLDTPVLEY